MAEPASTTSTGLAAALVAVFGTVAGEYATIVFAALAGGLWSLARTPTSTKSVGALFLVRVVGAAAVFTSLVAWYLAPKIGATATQLLAPVAFLIGAVGERWQIILGDLFGRLRRRTSQPEDSALDESRGKP